MEDGLCRCSFFLWFGVGGRSCSNFLASTVQDLGRVDLESSCCLAMQVSSCTGLRSHKFIIVGSLKGKICCKNSDVLQERSALKVAWSGHKSPVVQAAGFIDLPASMLQQVTRFFVLALDLEQPHARNRDPTAPRQLLQHKALPPNGILHNKPVENGFRASSSKPVQIWRVCHAV